MWHRKWFDPFGGLGGEKKYRRSFCLVVAVFITLSALVVWSFFAKIERVVQAEGRLIPVDKSQMLQHLEGGVVTKIVVSEGQKVKKGDLIMLIGDELGSTGLNSKIAHKRALRARIVRLLAESKNQDDLHFPNDLRNMEEARSEEANFYTRRSFNRRSRDIIRKQIRQKLAAIEEQVVRGVELRKEASLEYEKLGLLEGLLKEGAASKLELLNQRSRLQNFKSKIKDTEVALPKLRASLAEFKDRLAGNRERFASEVAQKLVQTRLELRKVSETIIAGLDRVRRAEIRAPVDGIVKRIDVNTVGGVVRPGQTVAELTPTKDKLLVEARVRPSDRAGLRPGMKGRVRLSAYDFGLFGSIPGEIEEISPDTLADQRGRRFYRVKFAINVLGSALQGKPILPGMNARVDIVKGSRAVFAFFLSRYMRFARNAFSEVN